ncbi:hypothetical protein BDC45DRAFT_535962 [Circinella umbellata]|nr:hypothetical protein BDC45DRAFT_535962 [Circinella umbellata]
MFQNYKTNPVHIACIDVCVYDSHLCQCTYVQAVYVSLDHYENMEGIKCPNTRSRTYNTKNKKYISGPLAKLRQNVTENIVCPSCTSHFDTTIELGNHLDKIHTAKSRAEVNECFRALKHNDKWGLSISKNSDDHPSQSLIFDLGDSESYIKNGVFTEEEIEEIKAYKVPKHEYENSNLMKDHFSENGDNIHIWCIIDHIIGDVEGFERIRCSTFRGLIADGPKGYTTRITDGKALQIPIAIISLGEKVLPILVQVYYLKVLVKNVFEFVRKDDK